MKHFLNTQDWSRPELDALLAQAVAFKRRKLGDQLKGRSIALVFFNPSLRTRTSFELGAFQLGGHAVVLSPGKDAWPIEFDLGTVMDGDTEEHIAEVARVLRPGARLVTTFSNRCFPTKAIRGWLANDDEAHCRIVTAYFEASGRFEPATVDIRVPPGRGVDPLYAVWATRR